MNFKIMEKLNLYFDVCAKYWAEQGCDEDIAKVKALLYDCIDVWNIDKTWTVEKVMFVKEKLNNVNPITVAFLLNHE